MSTSSHRRAFSNKQHTAKMCRPAAAALSSCVFGLANLHCRCGLGVFLNTLVLLSVVNPTDAPLSACLQRGACCKQSKHHRAADSQQSGSGPTKGQAALFEAYKAKEAAVCAAAGRVRSGGLRRTQEAEPEAGARLGQGGGLPA